MDSVMLIKVVNFYSQKVVRFWHARYGYRKIYKTIDEINNESIDETNDQRNQKLSSSNTR